MLCSENQYIGCWRKSRTNHTLSGRIIWRGNPRGSIRTFFANTTGPRTYHGGLQEPLELPGPASPRRKAKAPFASFQWSSKPNRQEPQRDAALRPLVGTINVILATLGRTGTCPSRVLSVAQLPAEEPQPEPKRAKMNFHPTLSFLEEDKIGTT